MAASTEGFNDTSMPGKDHLGSIISKVLAARRLAQDERQRAEQIAEDNQTSLEEAGIEKGYFFKAALGHEFYGDFVGKQKEKLGSIRQRFGLLKEGKFWDAIEGKGEAEFKAKSSLQRFRDKIGINDIMIDDPALRPRSDLPLVEDPTEEVSEEISGGPKRISREQLLASVSQIAKALEATASSITKTATENSGLASSIGSMNRDVVSQISDRTGTLEDKLQQIADAINAQTQYHKSAVDKEEDAVAEEKLEAKRDAASTVVPDDIMTPEDESKEVSSGQMIDARQQQEQWREQMLNDRDQTPGFERGTIPDAPQNGSVIMDGPDSGYPIMLHGKERVTIEPIDNNYTQGQPSAIDGKTRSKPSQGQYEMGTKSIGITPMQLPDSSSFIQKKYEKPLMQVAELLPKAVGAFTLKATTDYMNEVGKDNPIASEMAQVQRPIAEKFGLSGNMAAQSKNAAILSRKESTVVREKSEKESGFKSFINTIKRALGMGGDDTRTPTSNTSTSSSSSPGSSTPGTLSGEGIEGLADLIGSKESGNSYSKIVGGAEDASILEKTVSELNAEHGGQFALGRFQFQMRTAEGLLKKHGIDPSTFKFDQEGQDKLFELALKHRGLDDYLSGEMSEAAFMKSISAEWRALPEDERGLTYGDEYASNNKAHATYEETLAAIRALKEMPSVVDPDLPGQTEDLPDTPEKPDVALQIKDDFGLKFGDKLDFEHNGKQFIAWKRKGDGFRIQSVEGFGMFKSKDVDTSDGKNAAVVRSLIEAGKKSRSVAPPPSAPTPPQQTTPDQTLSSLQPQPKAAAAAQLVALNTGGAEQNPPATLSPPTASDSSVPAGSSQSLDAFYNPTPVA